jgi:UDP-N-acetylglucosamine--N-acetylmuramyl-(pentapeptide) pyrophosphoryl-undecaprenol N-acetylglucosamine transferase
LPASGSASTPERPTLLVTGGSQGARTVNAFVTKYADEHAAQLREAGWQILHQTGTDDAETVGALYAHMGVRAACRPFLDDIAAAWAAADASVCRAGAGTVAEAWATATPSLFLPYPFHKDAHQRVNAAMLTDRGAGVLGDDRIDTDANLAHNGPLLEQLLRDDRRRATLLDMLNRLGPADGADQVARVVAGVLG